jgi:hypothetical protein
VSVNGGTRALAPRYAERGNQVTAMVNLAPGGFWVGAGGVLMMAPAESSSKDDESASKSPMRVIGGVGVSGASADEDEHCAIVGAQGEWLNVKMCCWEGHQSPNMGHFIEFCSCLKCLYQSSRLISCSRLNSCWICH